MQEEKLTDESVGAGTLVIPLSPDTKKFLAFAETHRTVLNQILRQSTTHLADGPFSVLVGAGKMLAGGIPVLHIKCAEKHGGGGGGLLG